MWHFKRCLNCLCFEGNFFNPVLLLGSVLLLASCVGNATH
jgi:hypothetical protein